MDGKMSESNVCVQIHKLNHSKLYVIVGLEAQIMENTFLETVKVLSVHRCVIILPPCAMEEEMFVMFFSSNGFERI